MTDETSQRNTPSTTTIKSMLMRRDHRWRSWLLVAISVMLLACDDEIECEIGPRGSGCGATAVLHVGRGLPSDPDTLAEVLKRAEEMPGDSIIAVIHADIVEPEAIVIDRRIELRGVDAGPLVVLLGGLRVDSEGEVALTGIRLQAEIEVTSGSLEVVNTMLLGHVSASADVELWIRSSTIVDPLGLAPVVECREPVAGLIRNSLLISAGPATDVWCDGAMVLYSALEDATDHPGSMSLGEWRPSWFAAPDDLHLSDSAPRELGAAGRRSSTDPPFDIDGDARGPDDMADFAGADVPSWRQK